MPVLTQTYHRYYDGISLAISFTPLKNLNFMIHHFKQGDRALFVYEEDLMEGIVQDAHNEEVIIQFDGISYPSNMEAAQLQYLSPESEL